MQKRFLSLMAASVVAVVLFSSCSKKDNKQGRYIPATAGFVFHINGESLNSKLPWDEIKQNEMMKKAGTDTTIPAFAKALLDNPDNSGVNIKTDMEIFVIKDSAGGYMGIEGVVKDEAKLKELLKQGKENDLKETSKDGYTYMTDKKVSVGFNKERFTVAFNLPQLASMNRNTISPMSTDTTFGTTGGMDEVKYDRDMAKVADELLNLKEDASLANNEKFSELMQTKGDMHVWYSAEHFNMMDNLGPAAAMMTNLKKLTDGSVFTGTVNFDEGKISFDGKSYGNKDLTAIYNKYSGSSFDKSMIKNIPSKNLAGLMILNFKPQGILEILKLLGMDGLANMGLAQTGLTVDDITKATKGDMMISVTDVKTKADTTSKESAQFIFSMSVGDKVAFGKVMDALKKFMPMMSAGDPAKGPAFSANDKYFAISGNKTTTDAYLSGNANTAFPFMDKISGGPFGGYIDFQYIFTAMKPSANDDSLDIAAYNASSKMFDNLVLNGGNFKDGGISQHWELNLMDKNTNSLKQLNAYAGTMSVIEEKKKANRDKLWMNDDVMPKMDTTTVITPGN